MDSDGQMEVASQAGAYSSMSEELRGGGGGAALLLQPKWLRGSSSVWTPKGLWPRRGCLRQAVLGQGKEPRLKALVREEGAARTGPERAYFCALMGNCLSWLCLTPGDQVGSGAGAGLRGRLRVSLQLSWLPVCGGD